MALTYGQKPRIVVEESPWGSFFQKLPDMLLAFHNLKFQAEEAEKDRQFKESQLYLSDLMGTRRILQKSILDTAKIAAEKGIELDTSFSAIKPTFKTTAGEEWKNNTIQSGLQQVDDLETALSQNLNEIKMASMGERAAIDIDRDYSGIIDTEELNAYQKANPEVLEQLGLPELPISFTKGAQYHLTDPKVRQTQKDRFALNREIYDRYDAFLDKDEDGNPVQLYKSFDIDPNQRGKAELEQALLLLELGADPKIVQTQLSQVETADPIQYSFGDKIYTQVSNDQVITEDDGTMTAMMAGEKVKVVGDIAAYPGMKFVTGERYKPSSKGVGAGDPASQIWDKIQAEYDNSTAFYNTQLSSKEDRKAYISEEIGGQLQNPGKMKFDKGEMTKEGADKVKKILGGNILLLGRWGDKGWGIPGWDTDLEKLLSNGDYEGVVDYYMDPETQVARLKELDLSDSDKLWDSAADKRKAENAMTLFKQHIKDYDMLDRPADWLIDNPRIDKEITD